MISFRTAMVLTSLQGVLLLTGPAVSLAQTQTQAPSPEQVKAEFAGMTPAQALDKIMKRSVKAIHLSDKWPTNFPLPQYASNVTETKFVNTTKGRPSASASLITKDPAETVFKFYLDACRRDGWSIRTPSAKTLENTRAATNFYMLEGNKDKRMIRLICLQNPKTHATSLNITWFKTGV